MKSTSDSSISRKNKGQLMVEYLVFYTAIVLIVILFLSGRNSFFAKSFNSTLERSNDSILIGVNKILK